MQALVDIALKEITLNWESGNTGEFGVIAAESNCPQVVYWRNVLLAESANYLIHPVANFMENNCRTILIRKRAASSEINIQIQLILSAIE